MEERKANDSWKYVCQCCEGLKLQDLIPETYIFSVNYKSKSSDTKEEDGKKQSLKKEGELESNWQAKSRKFSEPKVVT